MSVVVLPMSRNSPQGTRDAAKRTLACQLAEAISRGRAIAPAAGTKPARAAGPSGATTGCGDGVPGFGGDDDERVCMQVIPVTGLSGGRVVHARRGQRELYQPLRSGLCAGSEPLVVVEGLLRLHPFEALYVADLDAIQGTGDNLSALQSIGAGFPNLSIWLDAGFADAAACRGWLAAGSGQLVLGSEAQADTGPLEQLSRSR